MSTDEQSKPAPRLHALMAQQAPIVLVFRRGPSDWYHLLRWHLKTNVLEPGVWVRKQLHPRCFDLSADGELLIYQLSGAFDGFYRVYEGVARAPWLHPLTSWEGQGPAGLGWRFVKTSSGQGERMTVQAGEKKFTLQEQEPIAFRRERRCGWTAAPDCPPPDRRDGQPHPVILQKPSPNGQILLRLNGTAVDIVRENSASYELVYAPDRRVALDDTVWAEWDSEGRLLTATAQGWLHMEELKGETRVKIASHDLANLTPDPKPAPAWATSAVKPRPLVW